MLSASLTKKQGGAFRAALIGYLKATIHGYDRAEYVIGAAALAAGIEKSSGYRLVNDMICSKNDMRKYTRLIDGMHYIHDAISETECIQTWRQDAKLRDMCLQKSDADIMEQFYDVFGDATITYMLEDVQDVIMAPKEKVIRYVCRRMNISRAAFYTFLEHPDVEYHVERSRYAGTLFVSRILNQTRLERDEIPESNPWPTCPFFTTPPTDYGDAILALPETPLPLWAVRVDAV